jgi:hypothetical protein
MKSNEMNSDPIERLFKHKLKDHAIAYNKKDWQKLEQRLNNADAIYSRRRNLYRAAAVLTLLLCVMAYFTLQNRTMLNRLSDQLNEAMVSKAEEEPADEQKGQPQQKRANNPDESAALAGQDKQPKGKSGEDEPVSLSRNGSTTIASDSPSVNESRIEDKETGFPDAVLSEAAEKLFISELSCPACTLSTAENKQLNTLVNSAAYYSGVESEKDDNITALKSTQNIHEIEKDKVKTGPRIALGLVLAPDLSTAGAISHFENPGFKMGITAQLRLTSHLALRTGLIHSNVRYTARGRDYTPPRGYWTYGVVPEETYAECALLDIPLSLKYKVLQFDRSGVFVTAGLSSYIMLSEDYRFRYEGDASELKQQWSDNTGTRHWFSNASFSAGYEWDIHPSWGIQVEPFINVPISGVGWGDVELYSVGSFVSFSYKIGSGR